MSLDRGRQYDLAELRGLKNKAKDSFWHNKYDQVAHKIMSEGSNVRKVRENLIQAVRGNDIRAIKRFNHDLRMIQANQTNGKDY